MEKYSETQIEAKAKEMQAQYHREWRAKNAERQREYEKMWREKNREHIANYQREYRRKKAVEKLEAERLNDER